MQKESLEIQLKETEGKMESERGAARMVPLDRLLLLMRPYPEKNLSQWNWPRLGLLRLQLLGLKRPFELRKRE